MIGAIGKAIGQLGDPRMRSVFLKGILGAIAAFIVIFSVAYYLLGHVIWADVPVIGWLMEWMGVGFDVLSGFLLGGTVLAITYFLFPPVMVAIMGIFLEEVCEAVEQKHYRNLGETRFIPVTENIINALKFLGLVIVINLLALPFYLATWWIAGLGFVLYYLINGYLFGREYFELVAHRRLDPKTARGLRRSNRGSLMLFGFAAAFGMTVPILNLFVPIIAAAAMVHIFMKIGERSSLTGATGPMIKSETTFP
ncbi:EI24 domain-containing protein [Aestuariispira insulae]|uniref:Uncharacterized protein involved in cysteine biosynthesis n=1 Tax=Aestuariispira insulae TaxID=1461337 RepID=A0A3D9HPT1_9PROT|nr:EI24 domain-containing protein [Aestuariispira insulae]RED51469.1 uncharacterized protein involved in cysteine biosynthesis [Aestuariispira insulae]